MAELCLRVNGDQNSYGCSIEDMHRIIECMIIGALIIGALIIECMIIGVCVTVVLIIDRRIANRAVKGKREDAYKKKCVEDAYKKKCAEGREELRKEVREDAYKKKCAEDAYKKKCAEGREELRKEVREEVREEVRKEVCEEKHEKVMHVLVQFSKQSISGRFILSPPFGHCKMNETSVDAAMRGVSEKTGIFLKRNQLKMTTTSTRYDCYATTDPVVFGNIKDEFKGECKDATGTKLGWLESIGASWACHGHYWVPVNSLKDLGRNEFHYFIDGTVRNMKYSIKMIETYNMGPPEWDAWYTKHGQRNVSGYVLIYKMM
jgi:hypothetical protein